MCTLRNFPHLIDHCIEWARDKFAELFEKPQRRVKKFCSEPQATLTDLQRRLESSDPADVEGASAEALLLWRALEVATAPLEQRRQLCAQRCYDAFHGFFRDQICDLIRAYPKDARVMKNGQDKGPFWSGHKRFPTAATYGDDADQWRFLVSATHILSQSMGAQPRKTEGDDDYASSERNEVFAASVAQTCVIPPYIPGTVDKDIEGDTSDVATPDNSVDVARAKGLEALQRLSSVNLTAIDVEPADFEKDDDYNFHVRFPCLT